MRHKALANILKTISTERRLDIIKVLMDSDEALPTTTIAALAGMPMAAASFNLVEMANDGIVLRRPLGRMVFYTVNRSLLEEVQTFFED